MHQLVKSLTLLLFSGIFVVSAWAQGETVTVPDVTGLSIPQAVAMLNASGLNVGMQIPGENTGDVPANTVIAQSQPAGTVLDYGTAVDLTIVQPANARLIYDGNDITLLNLTDATMTIGDLTFSAVEGSTATFNAGQIAGALDADDCLQIWSVTRNSPKDVEGCGSLLWRSTNNAGVHFWTQSSGTMRFAVQEAGIERAICDAAPADSENSPLTCEFYVAGGGAASQSTPFIYLAYTPSTIVMLNPTSDQWMPTRQSTIYNYNPRLSAPGASLTFGDENLLREEFRRGLGQFTQLAPGQCLAYTLPNAENDPLPEECAVVAQRSLSPEIAFWLADFEVESVTDGQRRICPAAVEGRLTRCIVPR